MMRYVLQNRRQLLTQGAAVGAAATIGLAGNAAIGMAADQAAQAKPTPRDVAILKFLAAAELVETDLWQQYAELAQGNPGFKEALEKIDDDLGIYSIDTTEDELSHAKFINAFLKSLGEEPVRLTQFETIHHRR